ncbi:MAG TPA: fused MFS/spermidine synthase [Solirubrobacteraceae bacterium]|nr:fused MFS/spermidine synthase [Solirubrobacteraceae bacterium]
MGKRRRRSASPPIGAGPDLVVERDPEHPSGRLLRQGQMEASYVDLADPTHLEFDYLRWIRIVLRVAGARRVLHVGGGACALARALAAEDPDGRQEVCESDARVLEIARAHLGLRRARGLRVRHAEGRAFIAAHPDARWDAVVIDAFEGARVPRRLITAEALAAVARASPLVLVNVVDDRTARDVRLIAAAARTAFGSVWTIGGRSGNTVVAGAAAQLDLALVAARAAADPSPPRVTWPATLAALLSGTAPLRDDDL